MKNTLHQLYLLFLLVACNSKEPTPPAILKETKPDTTVRTIADAPTIFSKKEVPILCYHQVRDHKSSDSKMAKDYIVEVSAFKEQMKALSDSGYTTISSEQLYDYLVYGHVLPAKPVMITFDDTRLDQYTTALPVLNQFNFKGMFFIMTVSLGRPGYMSSEQVKQLSNAGHSIGSHTWDHGNVKKYTDADWAIQVDKPAQQLEKITGRKINYFAYPFGLWNDSAVEQLRQRNYKAAFQLSAKRSTEQPMLTIRRIIVPGDWSATTMMKRIKSSF